MIGGLHRNANNSVSGRPAFWIPKPSFVTIGPGTGNPIGLTAGQLVMMMARTKSYAIVSSLASGNTTDKNSLDPNFPAIVSAFVSAQGTFGPPDITSGLATISIVINPSGSLPPVLNSADGLFYPNFRLIANDGAGNQVATDAVGAASGSTLILFGSPPFAIPIDFGTLTVAITVNQNTVF